MKKITTIFKVSDIHSVAIFVLNCFKKTSLTNDSYLFEVITKLQKLYDQLSEAINKVKSKSEKHIIDNKRDVILDCAFNEIDAKSLFPVDDIRESAKVVKEIMYRYGRDITYKRYDDETTEITALLKDLNALELEPHIGKLNDFKVLLPQLEAVNNEFIENSEYMSEEAKTIPAYKLAREIKKVINEDIIDYLNGIRKSQKGEYETMFTDVDTYLADKLRKLKS